MLQVGEHVAMDIKRPKKAGRIALQSFCQNFCDPQEDNTLTDDVDEGASGNCEGKKKDLKATGFKRCPKDAFGVVDRGCAARDDACKQFCKVRGNGFPTDSCSRKAGQHDHLCDLASGFQNMELVLRRHCTKECDANNMVKGNGGQAGGLCRKVCIENPDVQGKYMLSDGAEEMVCKKSIYKAFECQEEQCPTRTRRLDNCIETNVNAKGRVKGDCRPGGADWEALVQCVSHKCRDVNHNHQFIWDLRQEQINNCADAVHNDGAVFSHCLAERVRDFFVGEDAADLPEPVSEELFEAV